MRTLAIDIGGTKVALGFVDNGELIQRTQIPTPTAVNVDQFSQAILKYADQWIEHVDNIGVSTTGLVTNSGISAINPDTLAFPTPFPLGQAIEAITKKPVSMLNDAQAAALYEFTMLGAHHKNMAFVTVSTGVGGGIILDGKLHQGLGGLAGHIGHMVVDSTGPRCGCGQTGCVEAIASGTALQKASNLCFSPTISNIELFNQASSNPKAEEIIDRSANAIATLCCNLKASLDLDVIVLGGGVGLATGYMLRVQTAIMRRPKAFQVSVKPAQGSYDACLLGAAFQFKE